jgi:hypothetical protein
MIWVGNTFQFDIEALIPINRPSGSNGVIAQLHLYLNDIDPRGTGKPLFGGPSSLRALSAELISRTRSPSRQRSIQAIYTNGPND